MGGMPKKNSLTVRRVLTLLLTYALLCLGGGVVASAFFLPAVMAANNVARAVVPSLKVEGIDFDVTSLPQKSVMYAADGSQIAEFYADNREVVPIKDISEPMQRAVVAREDRRFFQHHGVDVQGVMRAFMQTFVKKGDTQGGSTLTQQYVKNVLAMQAREDNDPIAEYHASEQTIARKVREMLIAVQMEKKYTKMEILQGYLNIAQFGNHNLYGVETAAKRYFNTTAKDLNVVQAATIASITKNPARYDPSEEANRKRCEQQRNIVLDLMLNEGYITKAEHDEARATPLADTLDIQSIDNGCQVAGDAAFFCDYASRQILKSKEFGKTREDRDRLLKEGGLKIYTTMDVKANESAMNAARNAIPVDDPSGMEVMIAAIKPGTGEVLGFGINRYYDATDKANTDMRLTGQNFMVDEIDGGGQGFPVGSTWKPINMIAWMETGHSINESLYVPGSWRTSQFTCDDAQHPYRGGVDVWSPKNSGAAATNPDTPLEGLVNSRNTTQAAMGAAMGVCAVATAADQVGYHESATDPNTGQPQKVWAKSSKADSYGPSMMIGTVAASPLTMANVYATIGANGVECTPVALTKVVDSNDRSLKVPSANCHQAIDPAIAQTTAYALNQGVQRGGARGAQLDNGRKTFAKTGTNENTFLNTAGFVPNQVAAFVSIGDAQNPRQNTFDYKTINGVYHGTWFASYLALPTWKNFMDSYLAAINAPMDNDYGQAAPQYMQGGGVPARRSGGGTTRRQSTGGGGTTQQTQPAVPQQGTGQDG